MRKPLRTHPQIHYSSTFMNREHQGKEGIKQH